MHYTCNVNHIMPKNNLKYKIFDSLCENIFRFFIKGHKPCTKTYAYIIRLYIAKLFSRMAVKTISDENKNSLLIISYYLYGFMFHI